MKGYFDLAQVLLKTRVLDFNQVVNTQRAIVQKQGILTQEMLFSAMGIHMEHIKSNANKLDENLKFSDFSEDKKEIIQINLKIDQGLYDWADSTFTLEKFGISN